MVLHPVLGNVDEGVDFFGGSGHDELVEGAVVEAASKRAVASAELSRETKSGWKIGIRFSWSICSDKQKRNRVVDSQQTELRSPTVADGVSCQ